MNYHMHKFKFDSDLKSLHKHKVMGMAKKMVGVRNLHFHYYSGVCTYTNHTHYFSGITSFPIKTENGHIHRIEGILELNFDHKHKFKGHTFEEISYISHHCQ